MGMRGMKDKGKKGLYGKVKEEKEREDIMAMRRREESGKIREGCRLIRREIQEEEIFRICVRGGKRQSGGKKKRRVGKMMKGVE